MVFREPGPWQAELAAAGIPCHFAPLGVPDKRHPLQAAAQVLSLATIVVRHGIRIIHANEHDHYPLLRLVARLTRRPILVTAHFEFEPGFGAWAFSPPYTPGIMLFVSKEMRQSTDRSIPAAVPRDRVHVHWNALDIDAFVRRGGPAEALRARWPITERTVVIGTASAIRPRKRLEHFVELIARLRAADRDVIGVIAGGGRFGDDDYRRRIEELIAARNLGGACLMLGNIDPVSPFMRAIDVFVSTSLQEGLPMSICEAQACSKPVVSYEAGGIGEALDGSSGLVPSGDLDELTRRVMLLVDEPARRVEMGRQAERFVRKHFDAPAAAERQVAFYNQLLDRRVLESASA